MKVPNMFFYKTRVFKQTQTTRVCSVVLEVETFLTTGVCASSTTSTIYIEHSTERLEIICNSAGISNGMYAVDRIVFKRIYGRTVYGPAKKREESESIGAIALKP